jgi:hypothetical protein
MKTEKDRIALLLLCALLSGLTLLRLGNTSSTPVHASQSSAETRPSSRDETFDARNATSPVAADIEEQFLQLFRQFLADGGSSWGSPSDWRTKHDLCLNPEQEYATVCDTNSDRWRASSFQILALHGLQEPAQQRLAISSKSSKKQELDECDGEQSCVASAVLFNEPAWRSISGSRVNLKATLDSLVPVSGSSAPTSTAPLKDGSIIIKTQWESVKSAKKLVWVWDPNPKYLIPADPGSGSIGSPGGVNWHHNWLRVNFSDGSCSSNGYQLTSNVPVGCFPNIQITSSNISQIDLRSLGGETIQVGDYVVLVGMHIIKKVNGHWIWATLWWTDDPDYYRGQSGVRVVGGQWSHFIMKFTVNDASDPLFNPYIEGFDDNTLKLNCIACHSYAVYPPSATEENVANGDYPKGLQGPAEASYFSDEVRTDRLWSLVTKYIPSNDGKEPLQPIARHVP